MTDDQLKDAAITVLQSIGTSAYLHGIDYDVDRFKGELNGAVKYIKSQAEKAQSTSAQKAPYGAIAAREGTGSGQAQERGYHEG